MNSTSAARLAQDIEPDQDRRREGSLSRSILGVHRVRPTGLGLPHVEVRGDLNQPRLNPGGAKVPAVLNWDEAWTGHRRAGL